MRNFRFRHGFFGRRAKIFSFILLVGWLFSESTHFIDNNLNPAYISCNSYRECTKYNENRKTKAKSNIMYFNSWNIEYKCPLNSNGERISSTANYRYSRFDDIHWILEIYADDKLIFSKPNYQRKGLCEKDGKKYIEKIKTKNITFKL